MWRLGGESDIIADMKFQFHEPSEGIMKATFCYLDNCIEIQDFKHNEYDSSYIFFDLVKNI